MTRTAVYAGSFDPITYGHLDIINQTFGLFDKLYVAIGTNTSKTTLFSLEERLCHLNQILAKGIEHRGIVVTSFKGLLVDFAKENGADFIVRGIRDHLDFGYEAQLARGNASLNPNIQTVWLYGSSEYQHVSSSFVRELLKLGADTSKYTPLKL